MRRAAADEPSGRCDAALERIHLSPGAARSRTGRNGNDGRRRLDHAADRERRPRGRTCDHALGEPQHVLVRALGREPEVAVDVSEVPLKAGDYLLLCSDGLTRMLPDRAVADAIGQLREPQRICDYLIDAANRRGGDDNITVVVVEVMGNWWQRIATSWKRRPGGGHDAAAHPEV
ncbi:MAG: hypothetical protein DMG01_28145 [Acidobacteria bacterium]|nr:MAG: hypothetical protein DMG01_28145 [Acidobacteriota bacterium]